jgi:hypothetical protein
VVSACVDSPAILFGFVDIHFRPFRQRPHKSVGTLEDFGAEGRGRGRGDGGGGSVRYGRWTRGGGGREKVKREGNEEKRIVCSGGKVERRETRVGVCKREVRKKGKSRELQAGRAAVGQYVAWSQVI